LLALIVAGSVPVTERWPSVTSSFGPVAISAKCFFAAKSAGRRRL
jgi:hypothetical protein